MKARSRRKLNIILTVIFGVLMLAMAGLYLFNIFYLGEPFEDRLAAFILIEISGIFSIVRLWFINPRHPLKIYEIKYKDEIGTAFSRDPAAYRKLIRALSVYNENSFIRAAQMLQSLKKSCRTSQDEFAVAFFTALCYHDLGDVDTAVAFYREALTHISSSDPRAANVHSNIAVLYINRGEHAKAAEYCEYAIDSDPTNALAHHNLSSVYFNEGEYEGAKLHALAALEHKPNLYQAAGTLAIIHAIEGDTEESEKYYKIAVANGQNPDKLRRALEIYKQRLNDQE